MSDHRDVDRDVDDLLDLADARADEFKVDLSLVRRPLSVDQYLDTHDLTLAPKEDSKEADHRRFLEKQRAAHQQWLEKIRVLFGMGLVVFVLIVAVYMTFGSTNPDINKGGAGLLVAIISAALGFVAGRGSK